MVIPRLTLPVLPALFFVFFVTWASVCFKWPSIYTSLEQDTNLLCVADFWPGIKILKVSGSLGKINTELVLWKCLPSRHTCCPSLPFPLLSSISDSTGLHLLEEPLKTRSLTQAKWKISGELKWKRLHEMTFRPWNDQLKGHRHAEPEEERQGG